MVHCGAICAGISCTADSAAFKDAHRSAIFNRLLHRTPPSRPCFAILEFRPKDTVIDAPFPFCPLWVNPRDQSRAGPFEAADCVQLYLFATSVQSLGGFASRHPDPKHS